MEIDLTPLLGQDLSMAYGSVHTHGKNAAVDTWEAAKGIDFPLTNLQLAHILAHLEEMGFSEDVTGKDMVKALFVQVVAAEMQDMGLRDLSKLEPIESQGRLFLGIDGKPYYQL